MIQKWLCNRSVSLLLKQQNAMALRQQSSDQLMQQLYKEKSSWIWTCCRKIRGKVSAGCVLIRNSPTFLYYSVLSSEKFIHCDVTGVPGTNKKRFHSYQKKKLLQEILEWQVSIICLQSDLMCFLILQILYKIFQFYIIYILIIKQILSSKWRVFKQRTHMLHTNLPISLLANQWIKQLTWQLFKIALFSRNKRPAIRQFHMQRNHKYVYKFCIKTCK
jgi:hypothetical protein